MCLIVKNPEPLVTEKVTAYKVMKKFPDGVLQSPFAGYEWKSNVCATSNARLIPATSSWSEYPIAGSKFIHAAQYSDIAAFTKMLYSFTNYDQNGGFIDDYLKENHFGVVKCELSGVIYEGFDELDNPGFAATTCEIFPETFEEISFE